MLFKKRFPVRNDLIAQEPLNDIEPSNYLSSVFSGFGVESEIIETEGQCHLVTELNKSVRVFYVCLAAFILVWSIVFGLSIFPTFISEYGLSWLLPVVFFGVIPPVLIRLKHRTDLEKLRHVK